MKSKNSRFFHQKIVIFTKNRDFDDFLTFSAIFSGFDRPGQAGQGVKGGQKGVRLASEKVGLSGSKGVKGGQIELWTSQARGQNGQNRHFWPFVGPKSRFLTLF